MKKDPVYTIADFDRSIQLALSDWAYVSLQSSVLYAEKIAPVSRERALRAVTPHLYLAKNASPHSVGVMRYAVAHMMNGHPHLGLAKTEEDIKGIQEKMAKERAELDSAIEGILGKSPVECDSVRQSRIITIAMRLFGGLVRVEAIDGFEQKIAIVRKCAWCQWFGGQTFGFGGLDYVELPDLQFEADLAGGGDLNDIPFDENRFGHAYIAFFGQACARDASNLYELMRIPSLKALVGMMKMPEDASRHKDLENLRVATYMAVELNDAKHEADNAATNAARSRWKLDAA